MSEKEWLKMFGENLTEMMKDAGYSQRNLAMDAGLTESTICRYMYGTQIPKATALLNIAYVLDCAVDDLIDFNDRIIM